MRVQKFHACPNHCILYRGVFESLDKCPTCSASRWQTNQEYGIDKGSAAARRRNVAPSTEEDQSCLGVDPATQRRIPAKVMWYLPVVDRLKRIFSNPRDAELMRWHSEQRKKDSKIRHPADASQWKRFDDLYPNFASDPRNVRFALSTYGMNPFGELSSTHSTWPMIMSIYNLPPWLCHKRKYLLLTILIQGPRQPGIEIDVFLEPLLEDMEKLWTEGIDMRDQSRQQDFTLYAMIFVVVADGSGSFMVSGQIKGKTGCVYCLEGTASRYLRASTKLVYLLHRRFLI
jgi:hypothetical protein